MKKSGQLIDKTIVNVVAQSSEAILLLFSSIVLARLLSKDDYGTYLQIILIGNTTILLSMVGFPQSIYYFVSRSLRPGIFMFRTVVVSFGVGLSMAIGVFFMRGYFADWMNNPRLAEYGIVTALVVVFRSIFHCRAPVLLSSDRAYLNAFVALAGSSVQYVPVMIAAAVFKDFSVVVKVYASTLAMEFCIGLIAIIVSCRGIHSADTGESRAPKRRISLLEQAKYALPLGAAGYLSIVGKRLDQAIISYFFTPADYASYSRGAMEIPVISELSFTISGVILPSMTKAWHEKNFDQFLYFYHRAAREAAKLTFPCFCFLFLITPDIITLLYTREYISASPILRAYLFGLLNRTIVYGTVARVSGKTAIIFYLSGLYVVVNSLVSIILVHYLDALGPAIGTIFSGLLCSLIFLIWSGKQISVGLTGIAPWRSFLNIMTSCLAALFPVWLLSVGGKTLDIPFIVMLPVLGTGYAYFYVLLGIHTGFLTHDDVCIVEKWMRFPVSKIIYTLVFKKSPKV